jgi:hypothetical protein
MLLDIMPLPRNIRVDNLARREPDPRSLPLCRIGLLGLRDADLQADPLQSRGLDISERWTDGLPRPLRISTSLY